MERGLWALAGLVLGLGGWYLLLLGIAGWLAYLLIGVGVGIGVAVVGSLAHDALAGTSERP
jgi:hypothetical protein